MSKKEPYVDIAKRIIDESQSRAEKTGDIGHALIIGQMTLQMIVIKLLENISDRMELKK